MYVYVAGMGREVENLILENTELLATKWVYYYTYPSVCRLSVATPQNNTQYYTWYQMALLILFLLQILNGHSFYVWPGEWFGFVFLCVSDVECDWESIADMITHYKLDSTYMYTLCNEIKSSTCI